jgi:Flp pilus assembly protein TadG
MAQVFRHPRRGALGRLIEDRRGAVALEFALVAPCLCLAIFGSMEIGRMVWTQASLNYAVEEAARCASVTPSVCGTSDQTASYAAGVIATGVTADAFTGTTAACGHQVSASYAYQFIATGLFSAAPTLTASACYP